MAAARGRKGPLRLAHSGQAGQPCLCPLFRRSRHKPQGTPQLLEKPLQLWPRVSLSLAPGRGACVGLRPDPSAARHPGPNRRAHSPRVQEGPPTHRKDVPVWPGLGLALASLGTGFCDLLLEPRSGVRGALALVSESAGMQVPAGPEHGGGVTPQGAEPPACPPDLC